LRNQKITIEYRKLIHPPITSGYRYLAIQRSKPHIKLPKGYLTAIPVINFVTIC